MDPPGKTLLQFIDPDTAVRIDVFRVYGATMDRISRLELSSGTLGLVSLEDLVARAARLTLDLAQKVEVPAKHAIDLMRLIELVNFADVGTIWQDHRKPMHPGTFEAVITLIWNLIAGQPELLTTPQYSKNTESACARCQPTDVFQLADSKVILSMLGYC